jgi:chromosome segregation ATPase
MELPQKNEIIDLREIMEEYKEPFKVYEKSIKELNESLTEEKREKKQATTELEELRREHTKIKTNYEGLNQ